MAVDQSLANALFGALIVLCGLLLLMEFGTPTTKSPQKCSGSRTPRTHRRSCSTM